MGAGLCITSPANHVMKIEAEINNNFASLPKLFAIPKISPPSNTVTSNYLCSCTVNQVERVLVFTCTDTNKGSVYQKKVAFSVLQEIKDKLQQNLKQPKENEKLSWTLLFTALKSSFQNKKVELTPPEHVTQNGVEKCVLTPELNLGAFGIQKISWNLRRVEDSSELLSSFFVSPLFEFYTLRTDEMGDRTSELEKQLMKCNETIHLLEQEVREE